MWQCRYQLYKVVAWKKASTKLFSSLFSGRWMRKSPGIGSTSICSLGETTSSRSRWCNCQPIIFDDSKRWFVLPKLSQQETCHHLTRCCNSSGFACLSTQRIVQSTLRVVDVFVRRCLSLLPSASRKFITCKWLLAPLWRNTSIRLSIVWVSKAKSIVRTKKLKVVLPLWVEAARLKGLSVCKLWA